MKGLIASDIDGTLAPEGGSTLSPEVFDQILRLTQSGWYFAAASGRQYNSVRRFFAPVAHRISYICANGGAVFGSDGSVLGTTVLPRARAVELAEEIQSLPGCEVLISGLDLNYVLSRDGFLYGFMREVMSHDVTAVDSPQAVPEEIVKISAYVFDGAASYPQALREKWAMFHPAISGRCWVDFTLADKGTGLAQLARALGVPMENTIAFGDNYNDEPMLAQAGTGYIMSTASPALLQRFPHHCHCVLDILKTL